MKTICLYFEIHQIIHLKRYRFFDIGTDHYYYDDYANETSINDVAERSYIPALNTLIEMVKNSGGAFKVAFSISGVALEQLEIYAPAVIDLLHQLNDTGCCEFLAEPYSHGLSSLANEDCFNYNGFHKIFICCCRHCAACMLYRPHSNFLPAILLCSIPCRNQSTVQMFTALDR